MDMSNIPVRASHDWPSIAARKRDRWICGVDLGKSIDSTATAIVHHTVTPLESWTPNGTAKTWKQDRIQRFDLLHLQRLPLGMSYVDQCQVIAEIMQREPLNSAKADLVVDQTGVGAGVADILDNAGLRPNRIVITSGLEVTQHGASLWHVSKQALISRLEAAMHTRELHVADALAEKEAFRDELQDFQRTVSAAGRAQYSAKTGSHDDIVLAVAIAIFFACNRPTSSIEPLSF